jgi:hypothetical protein
MGLLIVLSCMLMPVMVVCMIALLLNKEPMRSEQDNETKPLCTLEYKEDTMRSANRKLRRAVKRRYGFEVKPMVTNEAHEKLRKMVDFDA